MAKSGNSWAVEAVLGKKGRPCYNPRPQMEIPLFNILHGRDALKDEIEAALRSVGESGRFILGPEVAAFERGAAAYVGVRHAIGVASGTDALQLSLDALGVGAGDEVILPAFTFVATAEVVVRLGAKPVFADIDLRTYCMTGVKPGPRTKAIMPVHLFGHPANMDEILSLGVAVVEDGAQSFGAEYKGKKVLSFGAAGATSFYPTKNLGGWGDGGMIFTDDDAVDRTVRTLRDHGFERKYEPVRVGYNSRLDELQAAVLRIKLRRLDAWNAQRREAAGRYRTLLEGLVEVPAEEAGCTHVYNLYCIRTPHRDRLMRALHDAGIGAAVYYPKLIPQTEAFRSEGAWPAAERAAREILALPLFPGIIEAQQARVAEVIRFAL